MRNIVIKLVAILVMSILSSTVINANEVVNQTSFKLSKDFTKIKSKPTKPLLHTLKNESKKNENTTTINVSGFSALFIFFTLGLYLFLRYDISIRTISNVEFSQMISVES